MKKIILIGILIGLIVFSSCNDEKIKAKVYLDGQNLKGMTIDEIYDKLDSLESRYFVTAIDDMFNINTWEIVEGHDGKSLNKEMTVAKILAAKSGETVYPVVDTIQAKKLKKIDKLGSFKTEIKSVQPERLNNINIASKQIDGLVLQPNQEFSFNNVVGKRTIEKGYKPAPIFISTPDGIKTDLGVGGGICQVSTTLYNAVNDSHLKITERHRHSKKVNYVDENKDATVVYNTKDLKFINNEEYPIMIKVNIINSKYVEVDILENKNQKF